MILFFVIGLFHHSVLKLFTGLAIAALTAWKLIVNKATNKAIEPAKANTHQLIFIRYVKSCSHLCITHHARGNAIKLAIITNLIKSFDNNMRIFDTEAPRTFLTPISFVR